MTALGETLAAYREAVAHFRWDIPDDFNFGRDVVDRFGAERPALLWRDAVGHERRLRFGEIQRESNRVAYLHQDLKIFRKAKCAMLQQVVPWSPFDSLHRIKKFPRSILA